MRPVIVRSAFSREVIKVGERCEELRSLESERISRVGIKVSLRCPKVNVRRSRVHRTMPTVRSRVREKKAMSRCDSRRQERVRQWIDSEQFDVVLRRGINRLQMRANDK